MRRVHDLPILTPDDNGAIVGQPYEVDSAPNGDETVVVRGALGVLVMRQDAEVDESERTRGLELGHGEPKRAMEKLVRPDTPSGKVLPRRFSPR